METPSSTRRVTRSQALSAIKSSATTTIPLSSSKKQDDSEKSQSQSRTRTQDRSALFDITNDSPIVGLAMQTPSSGVMMGKRNMSRIKNTPGTGEALLRGQVFNLLQKVEEEADQLNKISMESRPFIHLVSSPMRLLAPTPANTPQVVLLEEEEEMKKKKIVITAPVVAGQCNMFEFEKEVIVKVEEEEEEEKSPSVTRSLMLDFSSDCSSVVTQNTEDDNDNSSVWSMQVNASTDYEEEEEEEEDEEEVYSYNDEEEEEYYKEGEVEGLCEGMKKMMSSEFEGKHVRFVYDSEDEEIVEAKEESSSPGVLRLKGFPTPKGKHVRFAGDDE